MTCDEVRELGGAYALDAVSVEERRAIEEHIESCWLHGELAHLRAAAFSLGAAGPLRELPLGLEERIMAAARAGAPPAEQRAWTGLRVCAGAYARDDWGRAARR